MHWTLTLTSLYSKTFVFDCPHEYGKSRILKIYSLQSVFKNLRTCGGKRPLPVDGRCKRRKKISVFENIRIRVDGASNMPQNAGKRVSKSFKFQIFPGEHAPRHPQRGMLWSNMPCLHIARGRSRIFLRRGCITKEWRRGLLPRVRTPCILSLDPPLQAQFTSAAYSVQIRYLLHFLMTNLFSIDWFRAIFAFLSRSPLFMVSLSMNNSLASFMLPVSVHTSTESETVPSTTASIISTVG